MLHMLVRRYMCSDNSVWANMRLSADAHCDRGPSLGRVGGADELYCLPLGLVQSPWCGWCLGWPRRWSPRSDPRPAKQREYILTRGRRGRLSAGFSRCKARSRWEKHEVNGTVVKTCWWWMLCDTFGGYRSPVSITSKFQWIHLEIKQKTRRIIVFSSVSNNSMLLASTPMSPQHAWMVNS